MTDNCVGFGRFYKKCMVNLIASREKKQSAWEKNLLIAVYRYYDEYKVCTMPW
jgi:hypothetical protein